MTTPRRSTSSKDKKGLTIEERNFLQEIRALGSWKEAAVSLGHSHRWGRERFKNPAFKEEYDNFFGPDEVKITERELIFASGDAVSILEEAKTATKDAVVSLDVECPQCAHSFVASGIGKVKDWQTIRWATELFLKGARIVKDEKSIKVEGGFQIEHKLETKYYLALQALEHGRAIPPGTYQELQELSAQYGFKLPALPSGQTVDAEYKVLEDEDDDDSGD